TSIASTPRTPAAAASRRRRISNRAAPTRNAAMPAPINRSVGSEYLIADKQETVASEAHAPAPAQRTTLVTTTAYLGVEVPSGLLKPPGRSSSRVATNPLATTAATPTPNAAQNETAAWAEMMAATPATMPSGRRVESTVSRTIFIVGLTAHEF